MRIHLGCGNSYLENYQNVELPENKHLKADVYADIRTLDYPSGSVGEIFLSHVFEHFDRPTAIALLIKWNRWLRMHGILRITVPDFEENVKAFLTSSFEDRHRLLRHIFGSHEAEWAVHCDGWYFDKFKYILYHLGFELEYGARILVQSSPMRYDLDIVARKVSDIKNLDDSIESILPLSLFGNEEKLYDNWKNKIFSFFGKAESNVVDRSRTILFFSKDRAMQLDCALGTLYKYCEDISNTDVIVLYLCSNPDYEVQYARLVDFYPNVKFYKETSFKNNLVYLIAGYQYCLFCVDDCIFTRPFVLDDMIDILEYMPTVIGFSLRLGENIKRCYMHGDAEQFIPKYECCGKGIVFNWTEGQHDFGYPIEVSSSIYRTEDILNIVNRFPIENPNMLEVVLDGNKELLDIKNMLACYKQSVAFCNAINKVQNLIDNRSGKISSEYLANEFHCGKRIKIDRFENIDLDSPHDEIEPVLERKNLVTENPLLSIIIPTYNGKDNLRECLASVCRNTDHSFEIIVVNNGTEYAESTVNEISRRIHLINNQDNFGPAVAKNQGLRKASGEYIVFLDDDTIVTRHWDSKFLEYMEKLPQVGMIGPRSNWASGYQLVSDFNYSNILELEKFSQDFGKYSKGLVASIRLIHFCLFMRKEVVQKIGAIDESFGLYGYEDDDYSLRAHIAGLNPAVAKNIFIHHTGGPVKNADKEYVDRMNNAWSIYKQKWDIPDHISREDGPDYIEIATQEFDSNKHYLEL